MDTKNIEKMIAAHCQGGEKDQQLHELLTVIAERNQQAPEKSEIEQAAQFVCSYVDQVPYMMKVAWTAACNVGLEAEMKGILAMVESYWIKDDDLIPDHMGIIGLLDDAYCSMTSLQAVSDHYQLQTGKYLFPDDLTAANKAMRQIIGDPYVSELDAIVLKAIKDAEVMQAVKSMATLEKQLNFDAHGTIWNHGPAGGMPVEDLTSLGLKQE